MDSLSGITEPCSPGRTPRAARRVFVLTRTTGFPTRPCPPESVVIAAAVLIATGTGPSLWLLIAAAAAGCLHGDVIAYHIGMLLPLERVPFFSSPRGRRTLAWAETAL